MMTLIISLVAVASAAYAFSLKRDEERRQQWQQDSRATWLKAG